MTAPGPACQRTLLRCYLHHNHTDDEGGAMYGGTATACRLTDNTSAGSAGGAFLATLRDCLIARNTASNSGGGAQEATLYNCTVVGNQAFAGGGVYGGSITNCIVWDNAGLIGPNWEPSGFASPPSHSCSDGPAGQRRATRRPIPCSRTRPAATTGCCLARHASTRALDAVVTTSRGPGRH